MATYAILENFESWAADPARKGSGECDYGCWWYLGKPATFPHWRVSVIKKTGEAYAVEMSGDPRRFILLGEVTPGDRAYPEMDAIMGNWAPDMNLAALLAKWG